MRAYLIIIFQIKQQQMSEVPLFRRFPFLLRFFFLRPYRVRGALNERLDLHYVLLFQLAGEIRHALVAERAVEDEVFQVRNRLGRDIAEVLNVTALVDARHTVAKHAVAHIKQRAGLYVGGIVLHTFEQAGHLVLGEAWWRRLATDGEGEDRSRPFHVGRPRGLSEDTAPPDRDRDILYAIDDVSRGPGDDTGAGWRLPPGDYEGGSRRIPERQAAALEEKELYVLRACGSPSREAPGSTSVWRP